VGYLCTSVRFPEEPRYRPVFPSKDVPLVNRVAFTLSQPNVFCIPKLVPFNREIPLTPTFPKVGDFDKETLAPPLCVYFLLVL